MSERSRQRFAAAVRAEPVDLGLACLLIGAEVQPDLDVEAGLLALDRLAATIRPDVPRGGPPAALAAGLRQGLGVRAGFGGAAEDYADLRSSLLHEVLRRRRGLPILLSVVWHEVGRRLDVPVFPVGLPGHFVVGVGEPEGAYVLVDPFAGGALLGTPGEAATPWPPVDVLLRVLTNIRRLGAGSAHRLDVVRTQLWATELSLLLPRHPLELRRERGHLLVRLGGFAHGAAELEAYADAVQSVDADVAALARRDAGLARARLN